MGYQLRLARELAATGIKGATQRRILAEIEDHLACEPGADLGDPGALARQFADELGTRRARRAAYGAFAALAAAGTLFAVAVFAVQAAGGFAEHVRQNASTLGLAGIALSAVGAQVALVAGVLACMRALRRRREQILSRDEAIVLVRRASVGLIAGLLTMAGLALTAIGFKAHIPGWWSTLALCSAGAGALALAAGAPAVLMARSLRPRLEGSAGDLSDDLRGLMPARLEMLAASASRWRGRRRRARDRSRRRRAERPLRRLAAWPRRRSGLHRRLPGARSLSGHQGNLRALGPPRLSTNWRCPCGAGRRTAAARVHPRVGQTGPVTLSRDTTAAHAGAR